MYDDTQRTIMIIFIVLCCIFFGCIIYCSCGSHNVRKAGGTCGTRRMRRTRNMRKRAFAGGVIQMTDNARQAWYSTKAYAANLYNTIQSFPAHHVYSSDGRFTDDFYNAVMSTADTVIMQTEYSQQYLTPLLTALDKMYYIQYNVTTYNPHEVKAEILDECNNLIALANTYVNNPSHPASSNNIPPPPTMPPPPPPQDDYPSFSHPIYSPPPPPTYAPPPPPTHPPPPPPSDDYDWS